MKLAWSSLQCSLFKGLSSADFYIACVIIIAHLVHCACQSVWSGCQLYWLYVCICQCVRWSCACHLLIQYCCQCAVHSNTILTKWQCSLNILFSAVLPDLLITVETFFFSPGCFRFTARQHSRWWVKGWTHWQWTRKTCRTTLVVPSFPMIACMTRLQLVSSPAWHGLPWVSCKWVGLCS